MLLSFWPVKAANPTLIHHKGPVTFQLPDLQDWKLLTLRWRSFPEWGKECVSLGFCYKGGRFRGKEQQCAKVDILRLTVGYLNATINRKTRNTEPEFVTDRSSWTRQNGLVDRYRSGFGLPRRCRSGFWMVLETNRTIYPVQTWTTGGLPGPVANTTQIVSSAMLPLLGSLLPPSQSSHISPKSVLVWNA